MRKAMILLAALSTWGQTSTGLTAIQLQGTGEYVSTSATNICSRAQVTTVRQTASSLVVANGASGTTPQMIRLVSTSAPRTRHFTAPITVTITGGSGVASEVEFWAVPTTTSVSLYVINFSGSTMSCSPSCTVLTAASGAAVATARAGVRLAKATVSAGNPVTWDVSGVTQYNTAFDCNLQSLSLYNPSGSIVTVTMTTASGLSLPWLPAITLDPGGLFSMSAPGTGSTAGPTTGIFHEGGLTISASTGGAVVVRYNTILYIPAGQ